MTDTPQKEESALYSMLYTIYTIGCMRIYMIFIDLEKAYDANFVEFDNFYMILSINMFQG